jgi:DNA-3-methyladenine glycosylase II
VPGGQAAQRPYGSKGLDRHRAAALELADRSPVLAGLVRAAGLPKLTPPLATHFSALVRSVVFQQLAGKAAAAIHARLLQALGADVSPEAVLALGLDGMRAVGLSASKAATLADLSRKVLDGTVALSPRLLARQADDEVVERLTSVRGIGPWTVHMFLIFQLRRLDVWPAGDLGVRRGYGLAWKVPMPSEKQLLALGDPFVPYRSVVAWYCWRAAELYAGTANDTLAR